MDDENEIIADAGQVPVDETRLVLPITQVPPPDKRTDRLTMRLTINHESHGRNPHTVNFQSCEKLTTRGQAYSRQLEIEEDTPWDDLGNWVKEPGLVIITNEVGAALMRNPSPAEKEDMAKQVLKVRDGVSDSSFIVRPGRFTVFECDDLAKLVLQSSHGTIPITIDVLPK